MELFIVILLVIAAAVYVGRVFYRGFRREGDCGCGCTGCDIVDSCSQPKKDPSRDRSPGCVDS